MLTEKQVTALAWRAAHAAVEKARMGTSDDLRKLLDIPELTDDDIFKIFEKLNTARHEIWKIYLDKSFEVIK